jgi:PilZ domain
VKPSKEAKLNSASSEEENRVLDPAVPEKPRRERRLHQRFSCEAPATARLVSSGIAFQGNIRDLSLTGCAIEFPNRFPVGINARVEILFSLHGLPVTVQGVSRCIHSPKFIGFEFLHVRQSQRSLPNSKRRCSTRKNQQKKIKRISPTVAAKDSPGKGGSSRALPDYRQ